MPNQWNFADNRKSYIFSGRPKNAKFSVWLQAKNAGQIRKFEKVFTISDRLANQTIKPASQTTHLIYPVSSFGEYMHHFKLTEKPLLCII